MSEILLPWASGLTIGILAVMCWVVLTVKANEAGIVVVDELVLAEPKTRLMARALTGLVQDAKTLVLIPEKAAYETVIRATNNLPDTKIILAGYLNVRDLMGYDKVVMPLSALDVIAANLG